MNTDRWRMIPFFKTCLYKLKRLAASRKFWRRSLIVSISCAGLALLSFTAYAWSLDVSKLNMPLPEPTVIMDRHGQQLAELSSSKLSSVPYAEFPEELKQAVIAVEDRRFLEHPGIDIRSTFRALVKNLGTGAYSQGGSTITQQLAKNVFLTSEKTILRKWKELAYSIKLERVYSKEDILTAYLNRIYFGEGKWGVKDAAMHYFSKEVKDLSLEESAALAALPKAPTRYSPFVNKEMALERRNVVLGLMKEQGLITSERYQSAAASPLQVHPPADRQENSYASYIDCVIEEAVRIYGFTEKQLLTAGVRIYTELEPAVQEAMNTVYANGKLFPDSPQDQLLQSAAVIVDHRTGGIRGLIGNRGEGVFRGFNRASQLRRQPGSTFKPLAVYAPALEKGYEPASALADRELNIDGYRPENYDHRYRGAVTMETALVQSLNVPAVWLLQQIGIPAGADFIQRAGITLGKQDRNYAMALGGLSTGVSPLQMAQAYTAFANGGMMHQAHSIARIATTDGKLLAEYTKPAVKVTEPAIAYSMTRMLQQAVSEGTGRNAALSRPTAGKSGTTQLPDTPEFQGLDSNTAKDAWFVGYTPELTAAVWLGYDQTDREHYLTTTGGAVPATLFKEMMSLSLQNEPVVPFPVPPGITLGDKPQKMESENKDKEEHKDKHDENDDENNNKNLKSHPGKGKRK